MKTKVLIIASSFLSDTKIGAKRWWNISKRLNEAEYNITVICRNSEDNVGSKEKVSICESKGINLIQLPLKDVSKKSIVRKKVKDKIENNELKAERKPTFSSYIFKNVVKYLNTFRNLIHNIYREKLDLEVFKEYEKNYGMIDKPDVIICTNPKIIGFYLNKRFNDSMYIVDYRDPPFFPNETKIYNTLEYYHTKKIIFNADKIFTVSYGFAERIANYFKNDPDLASKIKVVYNGFDTNEVIDYKPLECEERAVSITYTGDLYGGKRDASMLFKAINELISEGKINNRDVRIHYAGKDGELLKTFEDKYRLKDILVNHGFVTRQKAIDLQESSDILLMLTWNDISEKGVLTGKFMEYLRSQKPIIGLISGNCQDSEAKKLIEELNIGIACEYLTEERDLNKLKEFLQKSIALKQQEKKLEPSYGISDVHQFNYDNIAIQVSDIIRKRLQIKGVIQ